MSSQIGRRVHRRIYRRSRRNTGRPWRRTRRPAIERSGRQPTGGAGHVSASQLAPMTTGVRELRLWQEAVALGGDVVRLMRQSCRRETRALTDQITHTAVAVATCVADGYGRPAAIEQRD